MASRRRNGEPVGLVIAASIFTVLAVWVFASMMEAKTFNKFSDKQVTTWDAMWIKLRVQE